MQMNFKQSLLTVAIASVAVIGWKAIDQPITLQPTSRLWVDGTSNVRSYSCKAGEINLKAQASAPDLGHAVVAGGKAVITVMLKVPVEKLDCANGTMNEHMRNAMKEKEHADIEFRLESYDLAKSADSAAITLVGTLTIAGTAKPITMPAVAHDAGNGVLRVTGGYEFLMSQFGVKPPSLMMGLMKVRDKVNVHFDLLLKS
jgi:polyisoprenoid-binding protein YceI